MAHGSKKWITTYDGKIKRSNDRTKKDYYRDLKWWTPMEDRYGPALRNRKKKHLPFCPQCKHVAKPAVAIRDENRARTKRLWTEYNTLYDEANREWREYGYYLNYSWGSPQKPKMPNPPTFHAWAENEKKEVSWSWSFDDSNFLCFKCEKKNEVKRNEYWARWNFPAEYGSWRRRAEYNYYRNEIRNIMRKAKYEEEKYDDVYDKKNGWLD